MPSDGHALIIGSETQILIRETLGDDVMHPLVRCALPRLGKKLQVDGRAPVSGRDPRRVPVLKRRRPKAFARHSLLDGTLRVHKTENEALAVGGSMTDSVLADPGHWGSEQRVLGWARYRRLRQVEHRLQVEPGTLVHDAFRASLYLKAAATAFDALRPERLLHAAEEHVFARAFVLEARNRGVPSFFAHHAPTSLYAFAHDISADYFLARGDGERELLGALGARRDQMRTVGDPAIDDLTQAHPPSSTVMIGLYGGTEAESIALITRLSAVLELQLKDIVIAPHPRRRDYGRSVASRLGITVAEGRTISSVVRLRPRLFVLTYASGVRIEVEAAGVPTVSLDTMQYPFEESMPVAESFGDIEGLSLQVANQSKIAPEQRAQASRRWIAAVGLEARSRREAHLMATAATPGPVLDPWVST